MSNTLRRTSIGYLAVLIIASTLLGWFGHNYITQRAPAVPSVKEQTTTNKQPTPAKNSDNQSPPALDANFTTFVSTTLEERCPYYKPDGASYRECLSSWEQELGDKLLIEELNEVHAYCSTFTSANADETSLEGMELFLQCSIYKFQ